MSFIIKGKYVYTDFAKGKEGRLSDSAVYVDGDAIVEIGKAELLQAKYPAAEVIGGEQYAVLPGLINAHSHGSGLSHVQRKIGFDYLENSLYDWSECVALPPELNAPLTALRHLSNGCTTMHHNVMGVVGDDTAYDVSCRYLDSYKKTGMRTCFSPGIRDVNALVSDDEAFYETLPDDLKKIAYPRIFFDKNEARNKYFEWFEALYAKYDSDMTKIFLGPCWAHGSTDELLLRTKEVAESHGHLPIHIHTLQTPIQRGFGLKKWGKSLLRRMYDLGIVDDNLTLGHAVYLDEDDIAILAETGASITHHASCNLAMRNGISPVWYLQKAGAHVALGIDEKSINDDEDAFMELRMIYYLSRVSGFDLENNKPLTAEDVFTFGTRNAARSLGLEKTAGAICAGMKADIVLLELDEIENKPCLVPGTDPAMAMIHRALGRFVSDVFVNGKQVIRNRKSTTIDVEALYQEVRDFVQCERPEAAKKNEAELLALKPYMQAWYRNMDDFERKPFYLVNSRK